MISIEEVEVIHSLLIERYGGSKGLRDRGQLLSALSRPYQTFDQKELYPTIYAKAAAIIESIVINHPFVDGNKRIGYLLMALLLRSKGKKLKASQEEKYKFVILISEGKIQFDEILGWIIQYTD